MLIEARRLGLLDRIAVYSVGDVKLRVPLWRPCNEWDEHDVKGAFGREIAQPLQGGPIETRATAPVINEEVAREDLIAAGFCRLLEQVDLARYGFLALLFIGRDTGIQGRPCQASLA